LAKRFLESLAVTQIHRTPRRNDLRKKFSKLPQLEDRRSRIVTKTTFNQSSKSG
jgi:hypothetical protein